MEVLPHLWNQKTNNQTKGLRDELPAMRTTDEEDALGMKKPITHGGSDRGYKMCKCRRCEIVTKCTPRFDFYTTDDEGNGPLICERCLMVEWLLKTKKNRSNGQGTEGFLKRG